MDIDDRLNDLKKKLSKKIDNESNLTRAQLFKKYNKISPFKLINVYESYCTKHKIRKNDVFLKSLQRNEFICDVSKIRINHVFLRDKRSTKHRKKSQKIPTDELEAYLQILRNRSSLTLKCVKFVDTSIAVQQHLIPDSQSVKQHDNVQNITNNTISISVSNQPLHLRTVENEAKEEEKETLLKFEKQKTKSKLYIAKRIFDSFQTYCRFCQRICDSTAIRINEINFIRLKQLGFVGIQFNQKQWSTIFENIQNKHFPLLRTLIFDNCPLHDSGCETLCNQLVNCEINKLKLKKCGLSHKSCDSISRLIMAHSNHRTTMQWQGKLRNYDDIASTLTVARREDIIENTNCNHIDDESTSIDTNLRVDSSASPPKQKSQTLNLTEKVKQLKLGLTAIDLSCNNLTNRGIKLLSNVLKNDEWLLSINLRQNNLTEHGAMEIVSILQKNSTLLHCDIRCNQNIRMFVGFF